MGEFRRVAELAALYELEPTLRDVFVEGPSDRGLLKAFLNSHNRRDVSVYSIDTVEIDGGDLQREQLPDNNRSRVIYLAAALERETSVPLRSRVVCIADADLDHVRGIRRDHELLIYTDYTSLEIYAFESEVVQKFIDVVWLGAPRRADDILRMIGPPLRELFAVRLAVEELGLTLRWLAPTKACSYGDKGVSIDLDEFLTRYLNQGVSQDTRSRVRAAVSRWREVLPTDNRLCVHGEDFVELLLWTLRQMRAPKIAADELFVRRTLLVTLELRALVTEGLFAELLNRLPELNT